ncbi:hypothetical protein FA15DRAFT_660159 [Coprinopsis marcescibilis]|uniref:Uncharacterized protein n=1 Tax=Coprinopsis marcescibilis TaxID=230819 RepID=A0A5C3KG93_COPMA|nr:hypothetical protein FA15DRAFT_660159 [Coprinopsis marcescibilis]
MLISEKIINFLKGVDIFLVCKVLAEQLEGALFHRLVISISSEDTQQGFDILESLATVSNHPARTATKELDIQFLSAPFVYPCHEEKLKPVSEEFKGRFKPVVVPALKSLQNIRMLRLNYSFTALDWVYYAVLDCVKPMLSGLNGLEVSQIDSWESWNARLGEVFSILNSPLIPPLTNFAIDCSGRGTNHELFLSLATMANKVLERSRNCLESFTFNVPIADAWSSSEHQSTLDTLLGPSGQLSNLLLTRLSLNDDVVSILRHGPTVPQFASLTHLSCPLTRHHAPNRYAKSDLHQPASDFSFWTALSNTRVRLHSLRNATVSRELFRYLGSYWGALQELGIECPKSWPEGASQQELGAELWNRIIPSHQSSLRLLHVSSDCRGWWEFGYTTHAVFASYPPFPQLCEFKICVQLDDDLISSPKGYVHVNVLLDLVVQPRLYPSLKELLVVYPSYPLYRESWFTLDEELETMKIVAQRFPPTPPELVSSTGTPPNLTVECSKESTARLVPGAMSSEGWQYGRGMTCTVCYSSGVKCVSSPNIEYTQLASINTTATSIHGANIRQGLDVLEFLANAESNLRAANTATKELVIRSISTTEHGPKSAEADGYERRLKKCLVPALQSLGNIKVLRLNYTFTSLDWISAAVFACIKGMIPSLRGLHVSNIILGASYCARHAEVISILSDPQLHGLTSYAIASTGEVTNEDLVSSLTCIAANVLATSRTTLQSFTLDIPAANLRSSSMPPATFQTLLGQKPTTLTHLTLDNDFVSQIRSTTPMLPQLSSLTHLSCPKRCRYRYGATNTHTKGIRNESEFGFWKALANTGVRLRSLKDARATREMLAYLSSYSAELRELQITLYHTQDEEAAQQEMGADLWSHVITLHQPSLCSLHISSDCGGWWLFGPQTQDYFESHSFPLLQELKISVESKFESAVLHMQPDDYVNSLLDQIVQPELFPSLTKLLVAFPPPPNVPNRWCGPAKRIMERGKSKILAQKFRLPVPSRSVVGPDSRVQSPELPHPPTVPAGSIARIPTIIVVDYGTSARYRPCTPTSEGWWKYKYAGIGAVSVGPKFPSGPDVYPKTRFTARLSQSVGVTIVETK